jgi:endonuclease/exonuclease/phosphatase (EEP) superfamily protein YafD
MRLTSWLTRCSGWMLVGTSLALNGITVFAFIWQPDLLAAYTVLPIWLWGGIGIILSSLAFYLARSAFPLLITALWAGTVLLGADEASALANLGTEAPAPGVAAPFEGRQPIRVITLNVAQFKFGDPAEDLAAWEPDIVLLQEVRPHQAKAIADRLYQGSGDFRCHALNGVVTRWKITRATPNPDPKFRFYNYNVTVETPDRGSIEIVNLHLSEAATNLRLWQASCWRDHRNRRRQRQEEAAGALKILKRTAAFPGEQPVILGGDFNAPPSDPIQRKLRRDFTDTFTEVGTGWGNTYQRRIPVVRIDQIHASQHFQPVRCRAITTRHSDHRMVVADLILE